MKPPPVDDHPLAPGWRCSAAEALTRLSDTNRFAEVFRHGTLTVEMYAPRDTDPQTPHPRDEVYVVVQGWGEFMVDGRWQSFTAGDFLFVPAGTEHRFEDFSDNLAVWVIFYSPDGGEAPLA